MLIFMKAAGALMKELKKSTSNTYGFLKAVGTL
jgi:hypothetical protein